MNCKFNKPTKVTKNTPNTEFVPFKRRPFNKLKKQQFQKIIKTFIETGEWYANASLDPVDVTLATEIINAIRESRKQCNLFKTHLELKDKGMVIGTARQEFSMAICFAEQLSARLCPCLVPVHVCSDPTQQTDLELENITEASSFIASAPEAGT